MILSGLLRYFTCSEKYCLLYTLYMKLYLHRNAANNRNVIKHKNAKNNDDNNHSRPNDDDAKKKEIKETNTNTSS